VAMTVSPRPTNVSNVVTLVTTWVALVLATSLGAQRVPSSPLQPLDGIIKAPFVNVTSMHELSDGRVIMCDAMTRLLIVGNFDTGKFVNVEGAQAMPLMAFPGDTTVIQLPGNGWIFLDGVKAIGMIDGKNPVVKETGGGIDGADTRGRVLGGQTSPPGHGDSSDVLLVDQVTAAVDTITRLWMPQRALGSRPAYIVYEKAELAMDGWVAVLRANPYRVDWRAPDGNWRLGKPVSIPAIPLDDREKKSYMLRRANGGKPAAPETNATWPAAIPAWSYALLSPLHSPDGRLLVLRTPSADYPDPRYDVINRNGELERQVTLGAKQFILGFGARSVYVAVQREDGRQDVERHPWP
jgi:hypothetical protein